MELVSAYGTGIVEAEGNLALGVHTVEFWRIDGRPTHLSRNRKASGVNR